MTQPDFARGFERHVYSQISEELGAGAKLSDLDESSVAIAHTWAKRSKKKWPPRPATTGIRMSITSLSTNRDAVTKWSEEIGYDPVTGGSIQ